MLDTTLTIDASSSAEASYARQTEEAAPLTLPIAVLKALLPLVSCDKTRYALQGVFIEKSGWAVAINGTALGAIHLPSLDGWRESGCTLPKRDIQLHRVEAIIKAAGIGLIYHNEGMISFPNWREVIPAKPDDNFKATNVSINVRLLSQFTQLADLVGIEERPNVRKPLIKNSHITVFCGEKASLITFNNAALGVICHIRGQALPPKGLAELYDQL